MSFRNKLIGWFDSIHQRIFGYQMSQEMKNFLKNLSWSFIGGGIASVAMLAVNIWAGRLIGPQGYGQYNLVLALGQIFMVIIIFGLGDASIRAIARSSTKRQQAQNISSPFYFILVTLALFSLIFWLLYQSASALFLIAPQLLIMAWLFTLAATLKFILDGFARGLHFFKSQFIGRLIEVSLIMGLFAGYFFWLDLRSYPYYIYVLAGGALGLIIFYLKQLWPYLFQFNFKTLKSQLAYGKFLLLGAILGTAFNSLDKIIIAKYLNVFQLGIYGAYFTASTNLIAQASQMFTNVFFPTASRLTDRGFVKKLDRLYQLGFIPIWLVLAVLISLIMRLFGSAYGFNFVLVLSFSLLATLQIILTINSAAITAISQNLFKKYLFWLNAVNLGHILAYGILIKAELVSIQMIVGLLILNVGVVILIQRRLIKNPILYHEEKKH